MKKIIIILPLLIFSIIVINAQSNLLDLNGSTNPLVPNLKSQELLQRTKSETALQHGSNTVIVTDSIISYSVSEGDSTLSGKTSYEYDEFGFTTQAITYKWKENAWLPSTKTECRFLSDNVPEYIMYYSWNSSLNKFTEGSKFSYSFTTGTDSTFTITVSTWDKNELIHIAQSKTVEYHQSGKIMKNEQFSWNNDTWNLTYKSDYTYPEKESDYSVTGYVYDDEIAGMRNSSKTEHNLDETSQIENAVKSVWNKTEEAWEIDSKETNKYDTDNNIVEHTLYYWRSDAWKGESNSLNTFNEDGHITEQIQRGNWNWNTETQEWIGYSTKTLVFYDETGNKIYQENYGWVNSTSSWSLNEKLYFYYSELTLPTAVAVSTLTDVDVYPNPASHYFNIDMKDKTGYLLNIYNTNGALVLTRELQPGHNTIPIEDLAKGIYVCKITGKKDSFTSKMLVE